MQAVLLGILCLGSFAAGLRGGFVLDDNWAILQHPMVQGRAPWADAFRLNFWGQPLGADPPVLRPLATLSFALDQRLFGGSAMVFHVSSLLCYVGLVLAAWAFARRCMNTWAAFLAMAFFVVMPIHVENVSSLVGRADTLAALLGLVALLAVSPGMVEGKASTAWRLLLAALAFSAGMLCKESIAVLPVIVALFVEYRRRHAQVRLSFLRAHLPSLVLFASLGLYFVFRLRIQPRTFAFTAVDDVLVGARLWQKVGYGGELLVGYLRQVVFPTALCTGRKYAEVFRPAHISLAMATGLGLVALVAYLSWRSYRRAGFPFVLAAFAAWFLVSGLLVSMPESMADRFFLLPSLFLCYSVGPALLSFWRKGRVHRALLLTVLGVQVGLSNFQGRTWHDEGTLLSHAVRVCPDSVHNHLRYADYLSAQGETAEAVWHYAVAAQARHAFPYAWSHPARDEELWTPADQRLRNMHRLLQIGADDGVWRSQFANHLRSLGRWREARLVALTP